MGNIGWGVTALDVIDAEAFERLLGRVHKLPDLTRRVVTMRKAYGLNQEQIADRLGISPDDVLEHLTAAVNACADFGEIADA